MRRRSVFMPYAAIVSILYSASAPAWANDDVVPLASGDIAPFSGLLYPESAAARAVSDSIELERLTYKIRRLNSYIKTQDDIYKRALDEATTDHWYESPELNRWLGIFLGVGLMFGIVSAVSASQE